MKYKKLKEIIEFNPQEKINKKKKYKKIKMEDIKCFNKNISQYSIEEYNGGMKFRNGDTLLARITPCLENGKTSQGGERYTLYRLLLRTQHHIQFRRSSCA